MRELHSNCVVDSHFSSSNFLWGLSFLRHAERCLGRNTILFWGMNIRKSQLYCWGELKGTRVWSRYQTKNCTSLHCFSYSFAAQSMASLGGSRASSCPWGCFGDASRWECAVMENVVRPADNLRQQSQDPQGGSLDSTEGAGHGGHGSHLSSMFS